MIDARRLHVLFVAGGLAMGLLAAGCSGGGGGGGAVAAAATGGGSTSSGTTAAGGPNAPIGSDFDQPDVAITKPARGEYFSGQMVVTVEGTATDATTGVMVLTVNGQNVTPDAAGSFSAPVTLSHGANIIVARAIDWAGHVSTASISVMASETYRLATEDIPGAAGTRINETSLNAIAPTVATQLLQSGAIQGHLSASPLYRGDVRDPFFNTCLVSAEARVLSIGFGTPVIVFDAVPGGIDTNVTVPNLSIDANVRSYCGLPYSVTGNISATQVTVNLGLDISLSNGQYAVAARSSSVALGGFRFSIGNIPSLITNIVASAVEREIERRLADIVRQDVPRILQQELQKLAQPITRTWNGHQVTFRPAPESLVFDDAGFQMNLAANVTAARNPAVPAVPGSVFLPAPAGRVPAYGPGLGFYAGFNENVINRALFTSWQAGFWTLTIDQAFLNQFGTSLPFQLDGQLLAVFFPAIRGMITPGQRVPLSIVIEPKMQPVVRVTGTPDLFDLQMGELHMTVQLDFGGGFQPIFTVALHARVGATVAFANSAMSFTISQNAQIEADLLSAALPLNGLDLERFIAFLTPAALQVATQSMAPVPLPTLQGISVTNIAIQRDGQAGEFVTVSGDVR